MLCFVNMMWFVLIGLGPWGRLRRGSLLIRLPLWFLRFCSPRVNLQPR